MEVVDTGIKGLTLIIDDCKATSIRTVNRLFEAIGYHPGLN